MSFGTTIGPIPRGPSPIGDPSGAAYDSGAAWAAPTSLEDAQGRFIANLFSIELAVVMFTQKLALPLSGSGASRNQIALALVIHYGVLGILAWKGLLRVAPWRFLLFCLFCGTAFAFHARAENTAYSITSIMLVLVILVFYVFVVPIKRQYYMLVVRNFIILACVAGGLVWLDWATQIAGLGKTNLDAIIPEMFRYKEYNYWNRMWGGLLHIKPNGTFFLEMSHLSQFVATGLIFELAFFRRPQFVVFLGMSTVGAFGGTGLLVVACCLPLLLHRLPLAAILAGLLAVPVVLVVALQLGYLDSVMSRSQEFGDKNASGNIRFVKPAQAVMEAAEGPLDEFLMGHGAGTMKKGKSAKGSSAVDTAFAWAPYSKVIVEYGLIPAIFWFLLVFISMFRPGVPIAAGMALFVQYHLLNGALAVPLHTIYAFILVTCYSFTDDESPPWGVLSRPGADQAVLSPAR